MRLLPSGPARKFPGPPSAFPEPASVCRAWLSSSRVRLDAVVTGFVERPLVGLVVVDGDVVVDVGVDEIENPKPAAEAAISTRRPADTAAPMATKRVPDPRIDPSSAPHSPRGASHAGRNGFFEPSIASRLLRGRR